MTKTQALYDFFNSFGFNAYPKTATPDMAVLPYMTYESKTGFFGDSVSCVVDMWWRTSSEAEPNASVEEIGEAIGLGGCTIPYDDGVIWIQRGSPFCISIVEEDTALKRKQLNLVLNFM